MQFIVAPSKSVARPIRNSRVGGLARHRRRVWPVVASAIADGEVCGVPVFTLITAPMVSSITAICAGGSR